MSSSRAELNESVGACGDVIATSSAFEPNALSAVELEEEPAARAELEPFVNATIDLKDIGASLRALRKASQQRRYRNGLPPQLPLRAAVESIVSDLVAALYPRHFGPADLTIDSMDGFVAFTLERAFRALTEQARRELLLAAGGSATPDHETTRRASDITRAFAHGLPRVRALLDTDIRAAYAGDPAARSLDEVIFCYPGVAAVIRHRLAHQLYALRVPMLARIIAEISHAQTGIDIHPGAEIDEGFFIDHGAGVVIGETARIGKGVRLYQAVTLGAKRFEDDGAGALIKEQPRHPILGDGVVVYAGATVLGRVTIGSGSSIGGNVWLTHSVPPNSHITQAKAHVETFDGGAGIKRPRAESVFPRRGAILLRLSALRVRRLPLILRRPPALARRHCKATKNR